MILLFTINSLENIYGGTNQSYILNAIRLNPGFGRHNFFLIRFYFYRVQAYVSVGCYPLTLDLFEKYKIIFNIIKIDRMKGSKYSRHNRELESVLPLFVGITIQNLTRKRDLVEPMHERGLSVSYKKVLSISKDETNQLINLYKQIGVVAPPVLRKGIFTTSNLDHMDHNHFSP